MRVTVYVTAEKYEFEIDTLDQQGALQEALQRAKEGKRRPGPQRLPLSGAHGRRGKDETAPGAARKLTEASWLFDCAARIHLSGKRRFVECYDGSVDVGEAPQPEEKTALGGKHDESEG